MRNDQCRLIHRFLGLGFRFNHSARSFQSTKIEILQPVFEFFWRIDMPFISRKLLSKAEVFEYSYF